MDKISKEIVLELWKDAKEEINAEPLKIKNENFLEQILRRLNVLIEDNEDDIKIMAYALWSIPHTQPFEDLNHRTGILLFEYISVKLNYGRVVFERSDELFIKHIEGETLEDTIKILRKYFKK